MGLAAGAAIGAVGSLGAAAIGSGASKSAANAQTQAAREAQQTQLQMYNQTRGDLSPFMAYGGNAFSQLASIFGFGGGPRTSMDIGQSIGMGGSPLGMYGGGFGAGGLTGFDGVSGLSVPQSQAGGQFGQPNPALATQLLTQFPGYQFGLSQGTEALDRSAASRGLALSGGQLKDLTTFGQNYGMMNAWQPFISQLNQAASLGENAAAGAGNIGQATGAGIAQSQLAAGDARAQGISQGANQWTSGLQGAANAISPLFTSSYGGATIGGQTGQEFASNLNFNNYNPAAGLSVGA